MTDLALVRPRLCLIAAIAERDRGIGWKGHVPWVIPEDSQRFKQLTLGHAVIMGRRTWELDLGQRPLVDRLNVVVMSRPELGAVAGPVTGCLGVVFVGSLGEAVDQVGVGGSVGEVGFVIGGANLYAQALPWVEWLELTIVEGDYEADTFFPPYEGLLEREFVLEWRCDRVGYRFVRYRRRSTDLT